MQKDVSIFEVAKIAGVSKSMVFRALNDSYGISSRTREKVLKAAGELKYRANLCENSYGTPGISSMLC